MIVAGKIKKLPGPLPIVPLFNAIPYTNREHLHCIIAV